MHRMYSPEYQCVMVVTKRGHSNFDWLLDSNGRYFPAESFVPFHG